MSYICEATIIRFVCEVSRAYKLLIQVTFLPSSLAHSFLSSLFSAHARFHSDHPTHVLHCPADLGSQLSLFGGVILVLRSGLLSGIERVVCMRDFVDVISFVSWLAVCPEVLLG